jgi:hypothetical protein
LNTEVIMGPKKYSQAVIVSKIGNKSQVSGAQPGNNTKQHTAGEKKGNEFKIHSRKTNEVTRKKKKVRVRSRSRLRER